MEYIRPVCSMLWKVLFSLLCELRNTAIACNPSKLGIGEHILRGSIEEGSDRSFYNQKSKAKNH